MRVKLHQRGLERLLEFGSSNARREKLRFLLRGHFANRFVAEMKSLRELRRRHGFRRRIGMSPERAKDALAQIGVGNLAQDATAVPHFRSSFFVLCSS